MDKHLAKLSAANPVNAPEPDNPAKTGATGWKIFLSGFIRSIEGKMFLCGAGMAFAWLVLIVTLLHKRNDWWAKILTMGFAHMLAGRAASVAQATQSGMTPSAIVFLAVYLDMMIMLVMYGILVFSYKYFFEHRFFQQHMNPVFESARKRMGSVRRFQILGIFLLVWFPFWMTGVTVGSLLGFLLGFRIWVNILTVMAGTTSAMICWVYAYDKLFKWTGGMHQSIPFAITMTIIAILLLSKLITIRREKNKIK